MTSANVQFGSAMASYTLRVSVAAGSGARRWDVGDAVQVGVDSAWVLQYPVA